MEDSLLEAVLSEVSCWDIHWLELAGHMGSSVKPVESWQKLAMPELASPCLNGHATSTPPSQLPKDRHPSSQQVLLLDCIAWTHTHTHASLVYGGQSCEIKQSSAWEAAFVTLPLLHPRYVCLSRQTKSVFVLLERAVFL